jgi:hypothetical protein
MAAVYADFEGDGSMAKKRKTSRSRKPARPRTARRKAARRRGKSEAADPLHIIAALLVLVIFGLGIYLYQLSYKPAGTAMNAPPVAMAVETK